MHFLFGIDTLLQQSLKFRKHRTGLVTNNASTNIDGLQSRVALLQNGFKIIRLFSPEHGLNAAGADGSFQQNTTDAITGLPVVSLYGHHLKPNEKDLADIDLLIFDLPDTGCRFYTYQWTLSYIMEACASLGKPLIVCDRPNPLSGNFSLTEGPMLDDDCASFIGRWNIPLRHSCTIGELAQYWNTRQGLHIDLTIMPLQNWSRNQFFTDLNIPFVPTSPGIPDAETAMLYPGTGLLEGININEGRGTDTPFKIFGAPWMSAGQFNDAFQSLQLRGVNSSPIHFTPAWGRYANETCHGIQLTVTDANTFYPVSMGFWIMHLLLQLYPGKALPALYPTTASPTGEKHLEKLTGCNHIWEVLNAETGAFSQQLAAITNTGNWEDEISSSLLYC